MSRPRREQLIEVIRNGDDSRDKNIALCFSGRFDLVYDLDPEDRINYVGTTETLDEGNDYVGEDAANDTDYINRNYAMFLEAWIKYKKDDVRGQHLEVASLENIQYLEKLIDVLP